MSDSFQFRVSIVKNADKMRAEADCRQYAERLRVELIKLLPHYHIPPAVFRRRSRSFESRWVISAYRGYLSGYHVAFSLSWHHLQDEPILTVRPASIAEKWISFAFPAGILLYLLVSSRISTLDVRFPILSFAMPMALMYVLALAGYLLITLLKKMLGHYDDKHALEFIRRQLRNVPFERSNTKLSDKP